VAAIRHSSAIDPPARGSFREQVFMPLDIMLVVLFAALLHASWNALIKSGGDTLLDSLLLCICAGVLALFVLPFLPLPEAAGWRYLLASAAVHVVYFSLVAVAYRAADMSFAYPLMRGTAPLITASLAVLLLHEPLGVGGWLGIVLLCAGVAALALDGRRAANIPRRAWVYGLGNAAVIVCYTLIDGLGVRAAGNAWSYVFWLFALTAAPMLMIGWYWRGKALVVQPHRVWARAVTSSACSIGAYGLALWAMTHAPIALVAALRETSVLFGAAIAALLLNEKFGRLRWGAAGLVAAGAAAMKAW
jgi:drug/metabolite transporter (DMT)-like permease